MKILITEPIHESGIALLESKGYQVRIAPDAAEETLIREVADAAGLLVRMAAIPATVIDAARELKVIGRHGVGYEKIDMAAATRRKIPVCIAVRANAQSVAEHVLALMLALAKRIIPFDQATRTHDWAIRNSYSCVDLEGKALGVLGFGRIGSLVCQKAKAAFSMDILVHDPLQPKEAIEKAGGRPMADMREVLRVADVVTLHMPLTAETQGAIGETELRMMKPSAFLINCARGGVVNERALYAALRDGTIAGAGLDVYDPEPPAADNPLFGLSNVVLSPHSAALTIEGVMRMATHAAQSIIDVLEGRVPEGVVNPEALA